MVRATSLSLLLALAAGSSFAAAPPLSAPAYVALVFAASPEVRQAEEARRAADDAYKAQWAAMVLPTLAFSAQAYPYGNDPSRGYVDHGWRLSRSDRSFNTTVSLNLFNGFQDWLKTRAADEARAAAARALEAAKQDRAFAAVSAFHQLSSRARLREVARQDLSAQEEQYKQTQGLYRDGLKSLADLYKSETEWHASEIRLLSSESGYKASLQPFNELIGRAPWEETALEDVLTPGTTELPRLEEDAARLSERRAEIGRALREAQKAEVASRQALLGIFPTLSINAAWNRQDAAAIAVPNPNRQIGLTLSLPLGFNGATQGYNYAAARAEKRRAKAAADLALREARNELYASWIGLEKAARTYELAARQEEIAVKGLDLVELQYRQGSADALRMAQARSDLLAARVQRATALQDIYVNRAAYRRAAGVALW